MRTAGSVVGDGDAALFRAGGRGDEGGGDGTTGAEGESRRAIVVDVEVATRRRDPSDLEREGVGVGDDDAPRCGVAGDDLVGEGEAGGGEGRRNSEGLLS